MLENSHPFSSFSVDDVATAKAFYGQTLGLTIEEIPEGLSLKLDGDDAVFIYPKGPSHQPASFTVLNFPVSDVDAVVDGLTANGVVFEQFDSEYMKTDSKGIARGDGQPGHGPAAIAWFKDPAGNTLSIMSE